MHPDASSICGYPTALTKVHGEVILVSKAARDRIGDYYSWTEAEPMAVKGKSEPVRTFIPSAVK